MTGCSRSPGVGLPAPKLDTSGVVGRSDMGFAIGGTDSEIGAAPAKAARRIGKTSLLGFQAYLRIRPIERKACCSRDIREKLRSGAEQFAQAVVRPGTEHVNCTWTAF